MPQSLVKALIIGALALLLQGCSALRLAYGSGPQLAWWWIDGYVDFSSEQAPRAKAAIDQWFEWNRSTQLLDYAALLVAARAEVLEPATPAQVCRWNQRLRDAAEPALERVVQQAAELVPMLGEAQWRHIEQRFAKNNADMRSSFLQADLQERREAAIQRVVDRAETLYGRLDEPQRRVIAAGVAASPFDPQAWLGERERRQRDTVQTLRRLGAERADHDRIVAALRVLVDRAERSSDPAYRSYQQRLVDYNCAFAAQVHNATSREQRQAARAQLKTWEDDLRSLAQPPRATVPPSQPPGAG